MTFALANSILLLSKQTRFRFGMLMKRSSGSDFRWFSWRSKRTSWPSPTRSWREIFFSSQAWTIKVVNFGKIICRSLGKCLSFSWVKMRRVTLLLLLPCLCFPLNRILPKFASLIAAPVTVQVYSRFSVRKLHLNSISELSEVSLVRCWWAVVVDWRLWALGRNICEILENVVASLLRLRKEKSPNVISRRMVTYCVRIDVILRKEMIELTL